MHASSFSRQIVDKLRTAKSHAKILAGHVMAESKQALKIPIEPSLSPRPQRDQLAPEPPTTHLVVPSPWPQAPAPRPPTARHAPSSGSSKLCLAALFPCPPSSQRLLYAFMLLNLAMEASGHACRSRSWRGSRYAGGGVLHLQDCAAAQGFPRGQGRRSLTMLPLRLLQVHEVE
jgi:hypothetical protein